MASLAVKYRPKTWADVTEQSVVVEMLKNICEKDELQCRNFLLTGPAGCAKAQPLDSRVLTPSGFVTMKDIHVGDEVVTASNNIGQIASVHPQGKRNIYEMRCQDGATIQVADNHLNVVDIFNYRTGWSVENCVISTDKLLSYFNSHRYRISVKATHVDFNERSVPLDPYLVGVIAACGYATDCIHLNLKYASESTMKRISGIVARYNAILRPVSDENEGHYFIRCNNATYRYTWNDEPASIKSIISNIKAMTGRTISSSTVCKVASGGHAAICDEFPQALSLIGKADNNIFYKLSQLGMRETRHDMKLDESYIYNTSDIRTQVIEGMIACCGEETVSGTRMKLMSPTLAAQVVDIIRSLGFVSTIKTMSRYDIRLKHNIISYWVNVRLHDTNGDMLQTRPIVSIKSVGYHDCQCIYIDHDDHTYISDGFIPTHNTTLARIMANALNKDICEPIEIDAASNNGVDSVREIVKQASQYPIGSKYKVFIHDECFSGDVRVLTDKGYKRFDSLDRTEKIAQYNDDGTIEFVTPTRWVVKPYSGSMVRLYPKHGDRCVLMTPGHRQPVYNYYKDETRIEEINDIEFTKGDRLLLSGKGIGYDEDLSYLDKLVIASIADGYRYSESSKTQSRWQIRLSRQTKIDRILYLFEKTGVKWSRHRCEEGVSEFGYSLPPNVTKKFADYFNFDFSFKRANQFIDEVMNWDGSYKSGYPAYFSSTIEANSDFVSVVATLAGYSVQQNIHEYANPNHSTEYQVCMIPGSFSRKFKPRKEPTKFNGTVYCVEVPSHKIIVQANGFTFITGNCHAYSQASWSILLKTIEEQPAKTVMIFCTTNPEKIPPTIISRVQVFQLSKISTQGIQNRLKYILDCENNEGRDIKYDINSLGLIAKMANGGMRDAITLMEKSLSYSTTIDDMTLTSALGLPPYDDYFEFLKGYAKHDNAAISASINKAYNSGINFIRWIQDLHAFVMNVVKYIYMQDMSYTTIPSFYQPKLANYNTAHVIVCLRLANKLIDLLNELKTTSYQQEVALTYLCAVPKKV